ncbi:MAG TPA: M23 family metallopeptidase [Caldilineaceae bacterium]|nr:M23 family metallopeptidase [Caldilineaceae bacterium]
MARVLRAAPQRQTPIVGTDVVTTPVPDSAPPILVPTPTPGAATVSAAGEGYHEWLGEVHYVVQPGDTLLDVALETGVDVAMLPCAISPIFQPQEPLVIGDSLSVPGPDLLCHRTTETETLRDIAEHYQLAATAIRDIDWNQLAGISDEAVLPVGRNVRIPNGTETGKPSYPSLAPVTSTSDDTLSFLTWMLGQPVDTSPFLALAVGGPFANQGSMNNHQLSRATIAANQPGAVPENWPYGSGNFTWPLAGWLTQGYRYDHRALDIAAPYGTAVTAADRGVVVRAGWNNQGYGLFVIVDHNIDYLSLYAHLSEITVEEGTVVAQGQMIGKVGSTGNSTGPHLHFEVRDFGRLTNPLELLAHP